MNRRPFFATITAAFAAKHTPAAKPLPTIIPFNVHQHLPFRFRLYRPDSYTFGFTEFKTVDGGKFIQRPIVDGKEPE
jgi:hypothetical protein